MSVLNKWAGMRFTFGQNGLILQHRDLPFMLSAQRTPLGVRKGLEAYS